MVPVGWALGSEMFEAFQQARPSSKLGGCNQKIAGSNPASSHLATPFRKEIYV